MSKGEFRPLHHLHNLEHKEEIQTPQVKEDAGKLQPPCEELELRWQAEREKLKEEIGTLKFQLENLERERAKVLEERDMALKELEEKRAVEKILENLSERLIEAFKNIRVNMKEEVIELVSKLLRELLVTDLIPKEDVILRALSKVLESGVELKGQVVLYLNPKDFHRISHHLESLKERLGDGVQISPVVKGELKEGEFLIETPKLWIERRYDEVLQDLLEDMRNEGSV
ncbi:MAG: FliH/SctL family protein [Aquificaceae bacterium]|uniref:FliH/SctL family protein n=1 Tax=Hydrogenobacter sp. Uz 6-8 TaxID=3384828 RepID=UPI0030A5EFCA